MDRGDPAVAEMIDLARTALSLDANNPEVLLAAAQITALPGGDPTGGLALINKAIALNPNDADVIAVFANILVYWGRWREALTWISMAKRLNPFPPNLYHWYHALALYSGHEYEQAIKVLKEMRPLDRWSHGLLAACYAQTGRLDEARSELETFVSEREHELKERGQALPRRRLELALSRADRYRNPLDREHFLDGLRKAGLTG